MMWGKDTLPTLKQGNPNAFEAAFKTSLVKTAGHVPCGTLTTDGHQVCAHYLIGRSVAKFKKKEDAWKAVEVTEETVVFGMDPNRPTAAFATMLPDRDGGEKPLSFTVNTREYYQRTKSKINMKKVQAYLDDEGCAAIQSQLTSGKTSIAAVLDQRLVAIGKHSATIIAAYAESSSRKDRWEFVVSKERVRHRFARRIASLGMRDTANGGRDFPAVRLSKAELRRWSRKKKEEKKPLPERDSLEENPLPKRDIMLAVGDFGVLNIVLAVGDVGVLNRPGFRGSVMALKRLINILRDNHYVRAVVEVNECRTSQECNKCYHQGHPSTLVPHHPPCLHCSCPQKGVPCTDCVCRSDVENARNGCQKIWGCNRQWRLKKCEVCGTFWNRDVVAAQNIRDVFLFQNTHQGKRPDAFKAHRQQPPPAGGQGGGGPPAGGQGGGGGPPPTGGRGKKRRLSTGSHERGIGKAGPSGQVLPTRRSKRLKEMSSPRPHSQTQ